MGGDQLNGLATVIGIIMVLIILGGAVILALIGRAVTRKVAPKRRGVVVLLLALAGAGIGWFVTMATFYESSVNPPPELRLTAAPGFDVPWVVLLEDPRGQELVWSESALPFTTTTAALAVPPSGIVRVRNFGAMAGRMDVSISWPDGQTSFGAGGGPGPPGSGATGYILIASPTLDTSTLSPDGAALAAYIAEREGRPR